MGAGVGTNTGTVAATGPEANTEPGSATGAAREQLLASTFLALTDTLGEEDEPSCVMELLAERCVRLVDVAAAGLLLADRSGEVRMAAASDERARRLGLDEQRCGEGPGLECYRDGLPVTAAELAREAVRWPRFAERALESGYTAAFAVPLRRGEEVIGALSLFRTAPGPLPAADAELAQALADATTVGVLQARARQHQAVLAAQLQSALESRVLVEQAKGLLAERWQITVDDAFTLLRRHSRAHRQRLPDLARAILTHQLDTDSLRPGPSSPP